MNLAPARLEQWMRDYYFDVEIDLGSSGVESYSLADLREMLSLTTDDLDRIVFDDSRTLGGDDLRQAIADRYANGDRSRVMATHGSSEAIFLITHALAQCGDEVVAVAPCYQQLYGVAAAAGCSIKEWPLRADEGYRADLDDLRALVGPRTKMVVANFPHNPTGSTISREELDELIAIVASRHAYLLWDGAFQPLTYDESPLPDPSNLYERCISFGTLSKAFGLAGLRVGWCIGPPRVLEACVTVRDYITLHLSPMVELIAQKAIANWDRLVSPRLVQAGVNRALVSDWVSSKQLHVEWVAPRGGVCGFVRLLSVPDVIDFCRELATAHKVLLVPGACFGHPAHVRLGFGGPTNAVVEGLRRVEALLARRATVAPSPDARLVFE